MKIVLMWQPDSRTHVSIEGKSTEKVIAAAGKLMRFTSPPMAASPTFARPSTTDMPDNPKNKPK